MNAKQNRKFERKVFKFLNSLMEGFDTTVKKWKDDKYSSDQIILELEEISSHARSQMKK
jgi:hypothetical protein